MKMIVVGCGRVGSGLAKVLSLNGHTISVVDLDPAAFERLGPNFPGRTVTGVGFDRTVLLKAGIERVDGLAAVTAGDEVNLVTARVAAEIFHVPRVVARVYEPTKAEIYARLGLQTITPVSWGISRMAELLSFEPLQRTTSLGSGEVDLVEVVIPPLLIGRTMKEIAVPGEIQVVAISRHGKTWLPMPGTVFQADDRLHLAVSTESSERLKTLLAGALSQR